MGLAQVRISIEEYQSSENKTDLRESLFTGSCQLSRGTIQKTTNLSVVLNSTTLAEAIYC
ncbi:MAG: hypothetical protein V2I33_02800 [Kangiellaceae bacterium]|nr:hypothetical protein [Kangiellaceae bacterium]